MTNEKMNVPEFLNQKAPELTKPEGKHGERLAEIAENYDENDAKIVLDILAKKYPTETLNAIEKQIVTLTAFKDSVLNASKNL